MYGLSKSCFVVLGACLLTSSALGGGFYDFMPGSGTAVFNITPDGQVATGVADGVVYRWTAATGAVAISGADWNNTFTAGLSNDGNTIVSSMVNPASGKQEGAVWHPGSGWSFIGGFADGGVDDSLSTAYDVSGDGSQVVGLAWHPNYRAEGFSWTQGGGMVGLGRPAIQSSRASAISRDGSTVVGFYESDTQGVRQPVRWVNGGTPDLFLGESESGEAMKTNSDGSVIVGYNWQDGVGSRAFMYDGTVHYLGVLPEHESNFDPRSIANAVSDNGIVVGWSGGDPFWGDPEEGFVWTAQDGMINAHSYLAAHGVTVPGNLLLNTITSISADGTTFGGQATDLNTFQASSWIATVPVPEPASMAVLGLGALALLRRRKRA
ncbi:MAG TPA: PEP-CTERM sorting domain-containing protein [Fimbriimonadaceae bacterium]|nr:PEP-CTERM sorting domain-containing protein [Fimbriimonadaceae bacterium]